MRTVSNAYAGARTWTRKIPTPSLAMRSRVLLPVHPTSTLHSCIHQAGHLEGAFKSEKCIMLSRRRCRSRRGPRAGGGGRRGSSRRRAAELMARRQKRGGGGRPRRRRRLAARAQRRRRLVAQGAAAQRQDDLRPRGRARTGGTTAEAGPSGSRIKPRPRL